MLYVVNAFSFNMLPEDVEAVCIKAVKLDEKEAGNLLVSNEFVSAVGHEDTANILSKLLGVKIPFNRIDVKLDVKKDELLLVQYIGPRLQAGATELPECTRFNFYYIKF